MKIHFRALALTRRTALLAGAAVTLTGLLFPAYSAAAVRPDLPVVTIHLAHAPSYCVDVKNSKNVANATLWLYSCSQSKSDHWYELNGVACGPAGGSCDVFLDTKNDSLCLGLNAAKNAVLLGNCHTAAGPPALGTWVPGVLPPNGLRNENWGPAGELATPTDKSGERLYGADLTGGCGGCWANWSGY